MAKVRIADVYNSIISYYKDLDQEKVRKELRVSKEDAWRTKEFLDNSFSELSDEAWLRWYESELINPFNVEYAYRIYPDDLDGENLDKKLESVAIYLRRHFRYLMQNVFYIDMKSMKSGRTYCIDEVDRPIIQEILLRSVSMNIQDDIIARWLDGKISDDSYSEIEQLSDRLFYLIYQVQESDEITKDRWTSTLKLALRSDMAHTMTEADLLLRQIFSDALPFKYEVRDSEGICFENLDIEQICHKITSVLNDIAKNVQHTKFACAYQFVEENGEDNLLAMDSFPPYKLMLMLYACRVFYQVDLNIVRNLLTYLSSPSHTLRQKRLFCKREGNPDKGQIDELLLIANSSSITISQLRKVCDILYSTDSIYRELPKLHIADRYIDHFLSIDWMYLNEIERERKREHERYERKTQKKSKNS